MEKGKGVFKLNGCFKKHNNMNPLNSNLQNI